MEEEVNQINESNGKSKVLIFILVGIIIIGIIIGIFFIFSLKKDNLDTTGAIELESSSVNPFDYFSLGGRVDPGVSGEVLLNGDKLWEFSEIGGSVSSQKVRCSIRDGENLMELKINSVVPGTKNLKRYSGIGKDSVISLLIYAINEPPRFPKDEDILVGIQWNPADGKTSEKLKYKFNTLTTERTRNDIC